MFIEMYEGLVDLIIENQRFLEVLAVWMLTMAVFVFAYLYGREVERVEHREALIDHANKMISDLTIFKNNYKILTSSITRIFGKCEEKETHSGFLQRYVDDVIKEKVQLVNRNERQLIILSDKDEKIKSLKEDVRLSEDVANALTKRRDELQEMIDGLKDEARGLNTIINDFTTALDKAHALQDDIKSEGVTAVDNIRTDMSILESSRDAIMNARDNYKGKYEKVAKMVDGLQSSSASNRNDKERFQRFYVDEQKAHDKTKASYKGRLDKLRKAVRGESFMYELEGRKIKIYETE